MQFIIIPKSISGLSLSTNQPEADKHGLTRINTNSMFNHLFDCSNKNPCGFKDYCKMVFLQEETLHYSYTGLFGWGTFRRKNQPDNKHSDPSKIQLKFQKKLYFRL